MTDNIATLAGYTKPIIAIYPAGELHLLIRPDADLDDCFKAWDTDQQEFIRVKGWMFSYQDDDQ
jgi:hypothetical protein